MKILFYSTPALGHINSVYPVISRLVENGHKVLWYCTNKYKDTVENTGAHYAEYCVDFDNNYSLDYITSDFSKLFETLVNLNDELYNLCLYTAVAEEPDLILYDSMCSFGKNIAYRLGIKGICLCTTLAYNKTVLTRTNMLKHTEKLVIRDFAKLVKLINKERAFRKKNRLRKLDLIDMFINKGDVTIVFSPPEFQPFKSSFDDTFKFVGTTIKERIVSENEASYLSNIHYEGYEVYISLGSITDADDNISLINGIINSTYMQDKSIIVSGLRDSNRLERKSAGEADGNREGTKDGGKAGSVECVNHTEQLKLLNTVNLLINHGGLNSVYESLWFGVPQICIPMQEEQRLTAIIADKKKIGIYVDRSGISELNNKKLIEDKLNKAESSIKHYSKLLRQYDGTSEAVRIIEKSMGVK